MLYEVITPVHNAVQTNGYAINEEWCRFFKENHFLVGVSIDGMQEIHDTYRHDKSGNATFNRVKANVDLMEQYGVEYNILTVVNQMTAKNIKQIYEYYMENGWIYQQYIGCLDPLGEERNNFV